MEMKEGGMEGRKDEREKVQLGNGWLGKGKRMRRMKGWRWRKGWMEAKREESLVR